MVGKRCEICSTVSFKYKCVNCCAKYCSVACYNIHQASECRAPEKPNEEDKESEVPRKRTYFFETEDTVLPEKLSLLAESRDLIEILKDSELRHILKAVDSSADPSGAIQQAMQKHVFVKFVDECLRVVEP